MMDHIMNARLSAAFGESYLRIPLTASPNVRHGDALEIDWAEVLPAENCNYVFGNPPFIGAKYQSKTQRAQVRALAELGGSGGTLDFVCAWFLKAGAYLQSSKARIAFVSTNSITQGEQVAQLWPLLFERYGLEIAFGHRTFEWLSDARGRAHVHCVIVGLTRREDEPKEKRLFSYDDIAGDPVESRHMALSPYLFDATAVANKHLVVGERSRPIFDVPQMITGSKPIDGGYFILDTPSKIEFLKLHPNAERLIRPFVGADEYINGLERWIIAPQEATASELRLMPILLDRISKVASFRRGELAALSKANRPVQTRSLVTIALAATPTQYHVNVIPKAQFLVVPQTSSERREYIPIGWLDPPVIPSDKLRLILAADKWHFGVLTSRTHMAWMRAISGRLKSDFMYSVGVVYNNFPWPEASAAQTERISTLAQAILDARTAHPGATLADLYDPDTMPPDLRRAHTALDKAVDQLYRRAPFANDRERVEHLFGLYEKLVAPVIAAAVTPKKSRPKPKP
jgi:hypothetical protein